MRNTQKTLYNIGKIINYVFLGIYALVVLINVILLIVDAIGGYYIGDNISGIITGLIFLGLVIALIILTGKFSEKALTSPVNALAPVIILMAFGLVTGNILFTIGGVFGIVAASQENNSGNKEEKSE